MALRGKVLKIIGITTIGLILVLSVSSQSVMVNSYAQLEERDTRVNLERALNVLSNELSDLDAVTQDWASWDDTYTFIVDGNQEYVKSNLVDTTFSNSRFNLMLFANSSGGIVFSKAFDLHNGKEVPVPETLNEYVSPEGPLLHHVKPDSGAVGIVLLDEGPMLVASRPILTSQEEGPIRGALVIGRYLDSSEVNLLADTAHLSITVIRLDDSHAPPDFQVARSSLTRKEPILVRALNAESVAGYALVDDIYGTPILVLRVDLPRDIYKQGQTSISFLALSLLVVCLTFGIGIIAGLEKLIVSPVSELAADVSRIGTTGDTSTRVQTKGKNDELSNLADKINNMLETLDRSRKAVLESETRYRTLFDNASDAIFIHDMGGRFLEVNQVACESLGYSREELLDMTPADIDSPEYAATVQRRVEELREVGHSFSEIAQVRRDGTLIPIELSSSIIEFRGKPAVFTIARDITERKKAEQALRESEERFRAILDGVNDGILVADVETRKFCLGNNAICRMLGHLPEGIRNLGVTDIHPKESLPYVTEQFDRLARHEIGVATEIPVKRRDGSVFYADISSSFLTLAGRTYLVGVFRDITERKKAERAVRESEELYRHLIERQGEGLAILDLEQRFTFCNPRGDEIFGVSSGGMVGRTTREFTTPEAFEFIKKQTEKRLAGEKSTYEIEILRPDCDMRHLLVTAAPWLDKDGHVIGSVVIFRDETDRKRAGEQIRKLNQFLASIIDNTNVWLDVLDENADVVVWNKAAEVISGYSREEVVGHGKIWEWLYPDEAYRKQLTDQVAEVVQRGRVEEDFETRIRRKDGQIRIVSWNERNLLDELGKPIGSIAVGRDITERKRMEEKLKEYSEHLEQLVEERTKKLQDSERLVTIGQVAAMVGHDLRNPLQVLTNTLYLLEEGFKTQPSSQMAELLEDKRPMLLETMEGQVGYMNKIVCDLQDYARPLKPELGPINLRRLMDEILSATDLPESIEVSIEIEENVQELIVDQSLMKRAFTNLVANAVQAMPDGGRLAIRALKADKIALISIQDSGGGIPKENLEKVFTPMFSTKAKGQGFGLAACKRIVEAHGGTISLESSVGKGTTVFIKIPITDEVG